MRLGEADVVVVGGGAAGCNAALTAHHRGVNVLLIVKGFLGRSGCTPFAGNLFIEGEHGGPEGFYYLTNDDHLDECDRYTKNEWLPEMETRGLYIRRTDAGSFVTGPSPNYVGGHKQGFSGRTIADIYRRTVLSKGIRVMEETMVTSILTRNGVACGVIALDYARGEIFVVRAKAVIFATGHSNYLATRSSATREQCANGYAISYRVGAELRDLEIQLWHVNCPAHPKCWTGRIQPYASGILGTTETVKNYNSKTEEFFHLSSMYMQFGGKGTTYHLQLKRLSEQVRKGLAGWDGGYYTGYTHVPNIQELNEYSAQTEFWKKLDLDIRKDFIESAIDWHMTFGGLMVNWSTMESTVPHLYGAGGCVGDAGLGLSSFDGKIAGENAAIKAREADLLELDPEQLEAEDKRLQSLLNTSPREGYLPAQVKEEIRRIMLSYMGFIKNHAKMNQALGELGRVRREMLPKMRLETDTLNWNYDWVDAIDVYDMLDVCELTIHSAMFRKESRGPFYREDYPFVDNKNWLKHVVLKQENGQLHISAVPVRLRNPPPPEIHDYMTTLY